MNKIEEQTIIQEYYSYLKNKEFACVAARAALAKQQIFCKVAENLACPHNDEDILRFLYQFVDYYRTEKGLFHSAAVIFKGPDIQDEALYDRLMWKRLQALSNLDAKNFKYDSRVDPDPSSPDFSFSLKEEAFFLIGLHPASSRLARQFAYPTLVFNPHEQFERLRQENRYEKMKAIVRKRDLAYSGSVNPMLDDFGKASEVYQYSGMRYNQAWKCPLNINHGDNEDHTTP